MLRRHLLVVPACLGILLIHTIHPLEAQQARAERGVAGARIVERGGNHAKWENVVEVTDPISGSSVLKTNRYVQLENGMHYQNQRGEWLETLEKIELQAGYAVALKGPHKVRWAANINTWGAIELTPPQGGTSRSHVLGLAYLDPDTGDSVMIAEIQDSIGGVDGNKVFYQDAFDGLKADLRYTYTKAGFVQDVIIREQLPDPELWGFDPATVQLQVLTEFVENPPVTELGDRSLMSNASTNAAGLASSRRYVNDTQLKLGSMIMQQGHAFDLGNSGEAKRSTVRKAVEVFEGNRTILMETIEVKTVRPELNRLPEYSRPTAMLENNKLERIAGSIRSLPKAPEKRLASVHTPAEGEPPVQMAMLESPADNRDGYLIDYDVINGTASNFTIQGDTTYYITNNFTATGVTVLEGGAVIKFSNNGLSQFKVQGTTYCKTAPYRPIVFTAKDDNVVGATISGSSGTPSGNYALYGLFVDNNSTDLKHLTFRFCKNALYYDLDTGYPHILSHAQFVNCENGVVVQNPEVFVRNALFNNVTNVFKTFYSGIVGRLEHVTVNGSSYFNASSSDLTLNVTNSLLVNVTTAGTYSGSQNATASDPTTVFTQVGAGHHYLKSGSTHRNAGVTNISAQLLRDFAGMTTYAPDYSSNQLVSTDTTYTPLVARDTDTPDRGYHYPVIDYAFYALTVTNANIRVEGGTAIAQVGSTAFWLQDHSSFEADADPVHRNQFFRFGSVQEQAYNWGGYYNPGGTFLNTYNYTGNPAAISLRFCNGYSQAGENEVIYFYNVTWEYDVVDVRDCEFYGGTINFDLESTSPAVLENNLFFRTIVGLGNDPDVEFWNNTFYHGALWEFLTGSSSTRTFKDNLFFDTEIDTINWVLMTNSYNGYLSGADRISTNANDTVVASFAFEKGPLGDFYLPSGSALINAGSRTAPNAGLYHFTTQVNQVKEATNTVDLGYHYVGVDSAWEEVAKNTMTPYGSSTCCGWDATNVVDGLITDVGWVNNAPWTANEYLRIDLGSSKLLERVAYIPRAGTTPSPLYDGNNNGAYRKYEIYVSDSTSSWGNAVATGYFSWPNGQERRDIEFTPKSGRYVFFKRVDGYGWYGPYEPNSTPSYGYAGANEIWIYQHNGRLSSSLDEDGDTVPDWYEDTNGNGVEDGSETDWETYESPNGLASNPGLDVYTPLN